MKRALVIFLVAGFAGVSATLAQQPAPSTKPAVHAAASRQPVDIERFKEAISDSRRKLFAAAMSSLPAEQLQAFWAVYTDFEKEKDAITSARMDVAKQYVDAYVSAAGVADPHMTQVINDMGAIQKRNIDLRLKYFEIYSTKIDVRTAGRFALVDDYIATAMRLDLLDQIPFPGDEAAR
jgi:hypothetical protein